MEKTLNIGSFEAMDSREMMEVDGGNPLVGFLIGCAADALCEKITGKSIGHWLIDDWIVKAY